MPSATGWSANSLIGRAAEDDPQAIRSAGRDLLSLALIESRNLLLQRLAQDESALALRRAAHVGWYQEYWIARHPQRQRGERCDARGVRLAGIEPRARSWLMTEATPPAPDALRAYLQETLEITLELLAATGDSRGHDNDSALYFYRLALLHEDRVAEALAEPLLIGAPPPRCERDALWLPAQTWLLGSPQGHGDRGPPAGLVPHNERWAHAVAVPEFEIDAQPVTWARYAEFAADGGYDRPELWSAAGWAWVQAEGRRAPRHVEQLQGGVLVLRGSGSARGLQRAPAAQAVMHLSRHEAEAWCCWVGRRLPTEPEWELAACSGHGFAWGDVFEWVAGSARAWPGAGAAAPGELDPCTGIGGLGVLRGASFATRPHRHHPRARRFAPPGHDTMFCGFRSCAL